MTVLRTDKIVKSRAKVHDAWIQSRKDLGLPEDTDWRWINTPEDAQLVRNHLNNAVTY